MIAALQITSALMVLLLWAGLLASGLRRRRDHRPWTAEDQRQWDALSCRPAFHAQLLTTLYGGARRP